MTIMEFWSLRRAERRARKADRAMLAAFGQSWVVNRDGVYELLTAPAPLVVLDVGMLRGVVAEALAAGSAVTEEQALNPVLAEPLYEAEEPAEETFDVEPTAEVSAEPYVEERNNGEAAVPVRPDLNDDDKRRAFVRSFLQEQRAARGPVVPTR